MNDEMKITVHCFFFLGLLLCSGGKSTASVVMIQYVKLSSRQENDSSKIK